MELTYDRMNRKLSITAAVAQGLVIVLNVVSFFLFLSTIGLYTESYDGTYYIFQSAFSIVSNLLFAVMLFVVLLRAKKDVLAGIFLLLPVVFSIISILYSVLLNVFISQSEGTNIVYAPMVLATINLVITLIYRGMLATACFTKGRIFGQRFRIVLPIVAFGYVLLVFLRQLFSVYITIMFTPNVPIFVDHWELLEMSLRDIATWQNILRQLPSYAVIILTALAFLYPAKIKSTITEE